MLGLLAHGWMISNDSSYACRCCTRIEKKHPEKNKAKHESKDFPVKDKHHFLLCNLCTMKYEHVSDLERHIKSVHEDHENFECGNCKKVL